MNPKATEAHILFWKIHFEKIAKKEEHQISKAFFKKIQFNPTWTKPHFFKSFFVQQKFGFKTVFREELVFEQKN